MVVVDGKVTCFTVGNEECPASVVTVVLVTAMEKVAVKEESISCFHFYIDKR